MLISTLRKEGIEFHFFSAHFLLFSFPVTLPTFFFRFQVLIATFYLSFFFMAHSLFLLQNFGVIFVNSYNLNIASVIFRHWL